MRKIGTYFSLMFTFTTIPPAPRENLHNVDRNLDTGENWRLYWCEEEEERE